jgi:hypothetical protein
MMAPIESASVRTMATAAKTRATFRQFGSRGGGRRVVVGSSIQENHMSREYARQDAAGSEVSLPATGPRTASPRPLPAS